MADRYYEQNLMSRNPRCDRLSLGCFFSDVSKFFKKDLTSSSGFPYSVVTISNVGGHLCSGTELKYEMMSCLDCFATDAILDLGSNSGNVVLSNMLLLKTTSRQILLG